jgi:hypothetical protein
MIVETQNKYKPPQNPPSPRELAQDLSAQLIGVYPVMLAEAHEHGDLARVIGLTNAGRFSGEPANLEWVFEGDEDTRLVDDDFTRSYLESGLDPEGDQHDAEVARELYREVEALEPREGFTRAAIQVDRDAHGMYHTRVIGLSGTGDTRGISFIKPQTPCVRQAIHDLGGKWSGEGAVISGYLTDDFVDEYGHPKSPTLVDAQGVHYQGSSPEEYINFALHGGFPGEYAIEVPEDLLA